MVVASAASLAITLVVTAVIAVCGWFAGYVLAQRRAREERQYEERIRFLIEAWRNLESFSQRTGDEFMTFAREFESAIADIQLLGTARQASLAAGVAQELASTKSADMTPLLDELRSDLRRELGLEHIPGHVIHMRIRGDSPGPRRKR